MSEKAERNMILDYTKCILSILIVFIHVQIPGNVGIFIDAIARIGVPFFFIVSGYFCKTENVYIKRKIQRYFNLLLYSCIFYTIFQLVYLGSKGNINSFVAPLLHIKNLFHAIFFNMTYMAGHLWFLSALLYVYICLYCITKFNKVKILYILILPLLIMQIVLGEGLSSFGKVLDLEISRNFLFMGIPFFSVGLFIKEYEVTIKSKLGIIVTTIICFISFWTQAIERFFLTKAAWGNDLYVSSIICSILLFLLCVTPEKTNNTNKTFLNVIDIKQYPEFMYLVHPFIGVLLFGMIWKNISIDIIQWFKPIIIVIITSFLYFIYLKIIKKLIGNCEIH